MKFKVNKEACIGCGVCASLCEECFCIEEDGLAKETGKECEDKNKGESVLSNCPAGAIEVIVK